MSLSFPLPNRPSIVYKQLSTHLFTHLANTHTSTSIHKRISQKHQLDSLRYTDRFSSPAFLSLSYISKASYLYETTDYEGEGWGFRGGGGGGGVGVIYSFVIRAGNQCIYLRNPGDEHVPVYSPDGRPHSSPQSNCGRQRNALDYLPLTLTSQRHAHKPS